MKWTQEHPTRPGRWWIRPSIPRPDVVEVWRCGLSLWTCVKGTTVRIDDTLPTDTWWGDEPIPEPEE